MKMHSSKFKDPLIRRAQPVTVIIPIVEETLRLAGVAANRDHIVDVFMSGQPRIAVVHGGEDHPPNVGMKESIRRVIRQIWVNGALPFEVSQNISCEELAHGTEGANYALLSRNFCCTSLATHMEMHGYDAAIIIGACDRMLVGDLRALVEADLTRQRRKARPVFAAILPSWIGREAFATEEDRRRFEPLRSRMPEADRRELDQLLHKPLKPNVYAGLKVVLDRCFHRRIIQEGEKDDLERAIAKCTAVPGANCAASGASMVHRLMVASFGLVPRHLDIMLKAPSDEQVAEPVRRLISAIQKRERRVSVSSLVRSNLGNAASVWSATGGHPSWILHLTYLADAVNKKLTVADVTRRARTVPQIFAVNEVAGNSVYTMAVETDAGGNSGIDTLMRTLAEKRFIEDRAATLDGSWMQRIMDARSANGTFLHSTMTPFSQTCGLSGVHGNVCSGGVIRVGVSGREAAAGFDRKVYLTAYYVGIREFLADLASHDGVLERLKRKVSRDDLYYTWLLNWQSGESNGTPAELEQWNKVRLWDYLLSQNLLRIMIVVAGAGPRAAGMPELYLPAGPASPLTHVSVVVTDGRVSFEHDGISVAHVVPEAIDGGPLAGLRTGDWMYLDLSKGELHAVTYNPRHGGLKMLATKELLQRPDLRKRVHDIEKRRLDFLPSFRAMLDNLSSAEGGVGPLNRER